jgi:hypothetical protein
MKRTEELKGLMDKEEHFYMNEEELISFVKGLDNSFESIYYFFSCWTDTTLAFWNKCDYVKSQIEFHNKKVLKYLSCYEPIKESQGGVAIDIIESHLVNRPLEAIYFVNCLGQEIYQKFHFRNGIKDRINARDIPADQHGT